MIQLPTFEEASKRVEDGESNPLDIFIYHNEPAELFFEKEFREELTNLISFIEVGVELCYLNALVPNCGYEKTCAFSNL